MHTFEFDGTISHYSLNYNTHDKLAVVYRIISKEHGSYHKIRVLNVMNGEVDDDFELRGSFAITALSLFNDTITYSRYMDYYQYKMLQKGLDGYWVEAGYGPILNRTKSKEKIFLCTGLH